MAIGAAGQPSGSAYENYDNTSPGAPQLNVFATGTLQEDANGNYAFQSSDVVEYAVSPNDPGYFIANTTGSVIAMNLPANLTDGRGALRLIYTLPVPNTPSAPFNGLWLLVLDRTTLQPIAAQPCSGQTFVGPNVVTQPCGNTYAVAQDVTPSTADANWNRLSNDLASLESSYQLAILVSVNSVGNTDQPTTFQSQQQQQGNPSFPKFAAALQSVGGSYTLVAGPTFSNADSYSLVGFYGASNALVGGVAEASTELHQQGQFGVLHGTLQRNRNGLYQPGQTSQEPQPVFAAKGGLDDSDFAMAIESVQQPVDWPSNSASTGLPGSTSIEGQRAAYRFISHWLLAGYYVKGIAGPHQDDLHYFFSGSSNTWIDYHTMDAANLPFPGTGTWSNFACLTSTASTCTFQAPGDSAATSFTTADFNAVKAQMSLEVQYLTNMLQFLVTGSTNMKDVVAAGNANVGLALTGAAATILGSKFANEQQLSPTTQVNFSWQSLLGLMGGIASTIANAEGVGELLGPDAWAAASPSAQKAIKNGVGISNTIGALLATIGSGGSLTSKTNESTIPQPFVQFTTTIGQLANGELQSQLIVGFDVLADNLTSDWARLQSIGPRVVDVNDPLYAPNQVSQTTALQALTNASAQTFYFSLLPSFYHVDVWPGVVYTATANPTWFQPGVGSSQGFANPQCHAFYLSPNQTPNPGHLSIYQGMAPATIGAPLLFNPDIGFSDIFVIAGAAKNPNTKSAFIPSIDPDLATVLFAPDQLNISMQQFVAANGPMLQNVATGNGNGSNPSGWPNDNVCDLTSYSPNGAQAPIPPPPGKDWFGNTVTTTTLTSATSNTLGQDTVLTAVVKAGGQPVAGGIMYFSIDGQAVGKAIVGADGTATLTLPEATLGKHSVQADYAPPSGYAASSTDPTTLGVYAGSPDLTVAAASTSLDVSYDKPSQPLALTIGSVAGMAGDVQLSCTGLPAGMSCKFDTPTPTLAADGSVQVSVVIGPSVATEAALGLLFLPMLVIGWRREDGSVRRRALPALLALCMAVTALTGCSGDSSSIPRETGTKTVLINAAVGGVSRSVAIDVHID
jgi:Bacterial Ig-like domain (group 3)